MGKKLYVGNLSYDLGDSELQQLFEPYGTVQSAQVIMDRDTGRSKGFGFVEMGTDQEAQAAISALSGKQVGGVGMAVEAELDRATGCVKLQPGKPTTIAFLLSDESVPALRVVVQDPGTDAELYRSPTDIPVRLGV